MFNSFPLIVFLSLFRCLQYLLIFIMVAILSTNQRMCTKVKCQIGFVTLTIGVFFYIEEYVGKLGYKDNISMWYEVGGVKKCLSDDTGANEMSDWTKGNGKVHLFLVHSVSQPNYIIYSEAQNETNNEAQPEMHDGDSDDSGFGDSDDELLINDGFGDVQTEVDVLGEITQTIEDNEEIRKRLGGKKRKGAENEGNSSKKTEGPNW
jgi:hypothetical protein